MEEVNINNIFKEDSHLDENAIAICAEWLSGRIESVDRAILDHLEGCPQCKIEALEISDIISLDSPSVKTDDISRAKFEETCAAKHSPSIKQASKTNYWRVAAVLFVLASITALTIFIKPGKKESDGNGIVKLDSAGIINDSARINQPEITQMDSTADTIGPITIESVEHNLYAANFLPNPGLESLIGAKFRSGSRPSVLNPPADTTMIHGEKIRFRGESPDADTLELQLMDNKGKLIKSFKEYGDFNLVIDIELLPGLYYWKLVGEDELYQVGKIIYKASN